MDGCRRIGIVNKDKAEELFQYLVDAASYSFNKSHAVAYSFVSYYTLWLKTYYPATFMAEVLNASRENRDRLLKAIKGVEASGLRLAPPDLRRASYDFSADEDTRQVFFGLGGVKNLKTAAKEAIRISKFKPESVADIFSVIDKRKMNSARFKALIEAGAIDYIGKKLGLSRAGLISYVEAYIEYEGSALKKAEQYENWKNRKEAREEQERQKEAGLPYGDRLIGVGKEPVLPEAPDPKDFASLSFGNYERLVREHQALGFCVTSHPTDWVEYKRTNVTNLDEIVNSRFGGWVCVFVTKSTEKNTRAKKVACELIIEDSSACVEARIQPKEYAKFKGKFQENNCALFHIKPRSWGGSTTLVITDVDESPTPIQEVTYQIGRLIIKPI